MDKERETESDNLSDTLDIDFRPINTQHAISAMRRYLVIMEQQMPIIRDCEMTSLKSCRPSGTSQEEHSIFSSEVNYLEQLFEEDLVPTMRYSFIVFLHTVLETQLCSFCDSMQREHRLNIGLGDIRGSGIDQARIYLTKLVGIKICDYSEWEHLRIFQTVRNCIVHTYGHINFHDSRHNKIQEIASKQLGLTIAHSGRIAIDAYFCQQHLNHIQTFFKRLFREAGWKT